MGRVDGRCRARALVGLLVVAACAPGASNSSTGADTGAEPSSGVALPSMSATPPDLLALLEGEWTAMVRQERPETWRAEVSRVSETEIRADLVRPAAERPGFFRVTGDPLTLHLRPGTSGGPEYISYRLTHLPPNRWELLDAEGPDRASTLEVVRPDSIVLWVVPGEGWEFILTR